MWKMVQSPSQRLPGLQAHSERTYLELRQQLAPVSRRAIAQALSRTIMGLST
jgi:hypothetical protein